VSHVESCFAQKQSFSDCTSAEALNPTGLAIGTDPGEVTATATDGGDGYTIVAYSRSGNTFTIDKDSDGVITRSCETSGGPSNGGCNGSSW